MSNMRYIKQLNQVSLEDLELVGGKNASLGEMIQHLKKTGVNIPDGFVITVQGYKNFIEANSLDTEIIRIIGEIDFNNIESLRRNGLKIRQLIRNSKFPKELTELIIQEYYSLSGNYGQKETDVAVRSSATAEDLPDASFAGQQETYLNVRGPASLIDAVRNCFASLFTDRAISYRERFKFQHFQLGLSVCIQKMVRSDLAISGVAFSLDTETGYPDVVVINASYGLGEMIVQGSVSPDEFIVFKPRLNGVFKPIIEKKLGIKDKMMIYGDNPDERISTIPTEKAMQNKFCMDNGSILRLAGWVLEIEKYYTRKRGRWCPMDIEWAVDGLTGELFIVQARPETIHSRKKERTVTEYSLFNKDNQAACLLKGIAIGDKVATGKVSIMHSLDRRISEGHDFKEGDILVTDMTDPDWEPVMKKAAAIITNKGGRTCHAAIVAREMGIPAIIGCGNATEQLLEGQLITASCAEGNEGMVYEGALAYDVCETRLDELPKIDTTLMLNIGSPAMAFGYAAFPHRGVGLAREEFIINNYIKVHPMALLKHREIKDEKLSAEIQQLIRGFDSEEEYFISKLSFGIAKIASAFYPEKVIVRFSDFKSNEYFNLLGGKYFEPREENPMIGWRGASRYYSPQYKPAFALECKAVKRVREEMELNNVIVMIPFCRTVNELIKVKAVMAEFGLVRGENGLELYLMAEIPSNIIMAREFAYHIDGFSIGSNDLTQLTLGLDRDSSLVAHLYDERDPAVKQMIKMLIRTAKECNVKVGICGQGPSDFPDFAQFLVEERIDSISITPDSLIKTVRAISEVKKIWLNDDAKLSRMMQKKNFPFDVVFGFDMETDIGSFTPFYEGVRQGTAPLLDILDRQEIPATFYWTGHAAENNPAMLRKVKRSGHETGCHGLLHETLGDPIFPLPNNWPVLESEVEGRIQKATDIIQKISGEQPVSFRCPRLWGSTKVIQVLEKLGYISDASFPLYFFQKPFVPYHPSTNNWTKPGQMRILEIPNFCDLTMTSRDPYHRDRDQWPLYRTKSARNLMEKVNGFIDFVQQKKKRPVLCFYLHPWEFYQMPQGALDFGECSVKPLSFIVKNCGNKALYQFDRLCTLLRERGARFLTAGALATEYAEGRAHSSQLINSGHAS